MTSWEVFSLGRMPYPGISPAEVVEMLDEGTRLTQPTNAACSDDMCVTLSFACVVSITLETCNNFLTVRTYIKCSLDYQY